MAAGLPIALQNLAPLATGPAYRPLPHTFWGEKPDAPAEPVPDAPAVRAPADVHSQYLEYSSLHDTSSNCATLPFTEILRNIEQVVYPVYKNKLDVAVECLKLSDSDQEALPAFCHVLHNGFWSASQAVKAAVVYKLCHGLVRTQAMRQASGQ